MADLIQKISKTDVAGIVLFNRFYSPDIDVDSMQVQPSHVYSSPEELTLSLRWIALMAGWIILPLTNAHSL